MDKIFAQRLNNLAKQNELLKASRLAYLLKEAERKHFESSQVAKATGKSHAEKVVNAQSTDSWLMFHKELAILESDHKFQELKYEILKEAVYCERASYKIDQKEIGVQI